VVLRFHVSTQLIATGYCKNHRSLYTDDEREWNHLQKLRLGFKPLAGPSSLLATVSQKHKNMQTAAWLRELKRSFYGVRMITIAWSRFNSHPRRTRCCVLGKGSLRWLTLLWWLRTSSKLSGKKSKKQPENTEINNS